MNSDSTTGKQRRLEPALVLAIVFELVLIAAFFAQHPQGWVFIELHNLSVITHYLIFPLAEMFDGFIILLIAIVFIYEVVMVWLWASLFKWTGKWLKQKFLQNGITRNQRLIGVAGVACFGIAFVAWPAVVSHFDKPQPYTPSSVAKALVKDNDAFAVDLYRRLKDQPGNLFFSPYSISTGMGMVFAGARGNTERELAATLHFNLPQTNLHAGFHELSGRFDDLQHWNRLAMHQANSLWLQHDYAFAPAYRGLVGTNYPTEWRLVDFKNAAQDAASDMTAWIEKNTGGRIKGAIPSGVITTDTRLALCNTIYFKGRWSSEFKRANTLSQSFYTGINQQVTVPMMIQEAEFRMVQVEDMDEPGMPLKLLELPYYGHDLSMVIILPHEVGALSDLENNLNTTNLHAWLAELDKCSPEKTTVYFPRFTIQRGMNLGNELKEMGVRELFDVKSSDLSGMEPTKNLYVSDVLHQAFVDVDEQGTEAAAVTIAVAKSRGMTRSFRADHPFIFLIRDNASGSILFMGRLADPGKS